MNNYNLKENNLIEILDYLPKYIQFNGVNYILTIQKNDHEGNSKAYIARFSKENTKSISTSNVLIRTYGKNINEAVYLLYLEYQENWSKIIEHRKQKDFIVD